MVDLSTVKMPVVEYEDGTREPVFEYDPEDEDGEIRINGAYYNPDGSPASRGCLRIVAIHPAEPAADGWVSFNGAFVRDYGDSTVCLEDTEVGWQAYPLGLKDEPFEWDIGLCKTADECCAALDAAYARHLEPKPVLVWDDDEHCSRSHSGDATYLVTSTRTENDKRWFAHLVDRIAQVSPLVGGFGCSKRDEAKQACERHARGE